MTLPALSLLVASLLWSGPGASNESERSSASRALEDAEEDEEAEEDGEELEGAPSKGKKKKKNRIEVTAGDARFRFGGRVMTGWQYRDRRPARGQSGGSGPSSEFYLQQARLNFGLNYKKVLKIRLSTELADALDPPEPDRVPYLRNAFANVRIVDPFQIRAGWFRRPFSRLEMRGVGSLPFRGRGLANKEIVRGRNFGGRIAGMMLWGDIDRARLRWSLGAHQPGVSADGVDVVGRLKADATKWLSIGASGGYKRIDPGTDITHEVGSVSADFRIKIEGLYLLADFVAGQDYLSPTKPWAVGVVGYASYDIDLPKGFVLQTVMLGEWADIDTGVLQSEAMRLILGTNVVWRKGRVRVMPQVELIRPLGEVSSLNPWVERDTYYLLLALEI